MIAALFVIKDGPYFNLKNIDPYDLNRDAKKYKGPHKVIAHPPCERWGRYWGGGPMLHNTKNQKMLGDDDGCFAYALWCVRTFGGVLEHPEGSHAFRYYGLPVPNFSGGWTDADRYGGRSACVAQGHYGHRAQKMTWLYGVEIHYLDLKWGRCRGKMRLEDGFRSREKREKSVIRQERIKKYERSVTPLKFRDLLIEMTEFVNE